MLAIFGVALLATQQEYGASIAPEQHSNGIETALVTALPEITDNIEARDDLSDEDLARVRKVTTPTTDFSSAEAFESRSAGAATSPGPFDRNAFSQPLENLSFEDREHFAVGNALFRKIWVSSPSSTLASDGLGPLFNARGCQNCHIKDGRGNLPGDGETASSFLLHLGRFDSEQGKWQPDPIYGNQLQTFGIVGHAGEATLNIDWREFTVPMADGESVTLREPTFTLVDPEYGDVDEATIVAPRITQQMIGLGLLEAVPAADIAANADPDDKNHDGISGRLPLAIDAPDIGRIGRFGYKAGRASIHAQSGAAFVTDMGLSNSLHPANSGDCSDSQSRCMKAPNGEQESVGKHEVTDEMLDLVAFYSRNLAPPARRDVDDTEVLKGKSLFYETGCIGCHNPKFVTSRDVEEEALRFQLIWPYSDMLLHDMGEGLADGLGSNSGATGNEWRTPPLWGLGLVTTVNPRATFLHDGRARNLLEAIAWHGGEAQGARDKVMAMNQDERASLIRFLESL